MEHKQQPLFFDIETTGLSADISAITLIGCCDMDGNITQWFNEDGFSQKQILSDFLTFIKSYDTLITFNGKTFDLPFLSSKIKEFKLNASFDRYEHLDLYQILKPYKNLWGLKNFRQKNLEEYLGFHRTDKLSGKKLIKTYQNYLEKGDTKDKEAVLLHNREDLLGLRNIYSLMSYPALLDGKFTLSSYSIENDEFHAYLNLDHEVPVCGNYKKSGICLTLKHSNAVLTYPLDDGHLKHYHRDYKNYYYLPMEDLVIHKSMKSFVDTSSLVRADKDNCYSKFVPGDNFLSNENDVLSFCSDMIYYLLSK
jgi:hypothetical protein|nr:ribonuclease H-like domain-containing protein [uncultured Anaerostipes sp.]